jgi:hypothetical protein
MKSGILTVVGLVSLILMSCTSLPEPNNVEDNLTIGRVKQHGSNYDTFEGLNVNSTHYDGLILTLVKIDDKTVVKIKPNMNGYILEKNLASGSYELVKMVLLLKSERASLTLHIDLNEKPPRIEIENGKVNNLGSIEWESDPKEGATYKINFGYELISTHMKAEYSNSLWWKREEKEVHWQ